MIYLLPHTVDNSAMKWANRDALICGEESISYEQLSRRSNGLAFLLRDLGIRRGDRVGILMHKDLAAGVAIHGIMKCGAAYVPLDPDSPPERLRMVIKDCGITCVVTREEDSTIAAMLATPSTGIRTLVGLNEPPNRSTSVIPWDVVLAEATDCLPAVNLLELDLAYILYTSGSSGNPKGIMHTHRSGLSWAQVSAAAYKLSETDRISNFAPLHFDLSTFDYFAAASVGAATVIIPEAHTRIPASLSQLLADQRLTVLYCVPLALTQLLLHGALSKRDLTALRWVLFAGEPMPVKYIRDLMGALPTAKFANIYGPTETNACTHFILPERDKIADRPLPIGKPYPNVELMVIDDKDRQVNDGEIGELVVRSPTMMSGYWRRPELNEKTFYLDRLTSDFEKVFYRTGDLVRMRPDEEVEFLGRQDRQIKTRGHRVELDEVEAVLLENPAVTSAATFPLKDEQGGLKIGAAVVAQASVTRAEIREHVARRLPPYAIPCRIEIRNSMPQTPTGKVDRNVLAKSADAEEISRKAMRIPR